MNNITVSDIMNLKPCKEYTREVVTNLWQEKESLSLKEILDLDIPIKDRLWVLTELVPTEIVVKWVGYADSNPPGSNDSRKSLYESLTTLIEMTTKI